MAVSEEMAARALEELFGERFDNDFDDHFVGVESGDEYHVYDDDGRRQAVMDQMGETISYFRSDFLAHETGIDQTAFEKLVGENDVVMVIVRSTCGLDALVDDAVSEDGYGVFLSSYDGEEIELDGGLFAYRHN